MSDTPAIAAAYPECDCICAVTVARPEYAKSTAKDVAGWIRKGLTLKTGTVDSLRADPTYFRDCGGPRHGRRP